MNKTVNINLAGIFFHIDEDAYLKLQRYLEAIKRSFTDSQGRSEIISDIEARIAELFSERMQNNRQVIGNKEVEEVISIMGQPEDYLVDDEIFEDEPQPHYQRKTAPSKKLFRDTENSYISGVASGLGHYLGVDAVWVRLLWIILSLGSGGTFLFIYVLFWILVPEAKTTAEKIMMTGEPVNISNIEKKIKDGFDTVSETVSGVAKNVSDSVSGAAKNVSDAAKKVDLNKQGNKIKSSSKTFFDTLADVIMFFFKIFAKFIGIILIFVGAVTLIALIIGLFSLGVADIVHIPGIDFADIVNAGNSPVWLISLFVFFAIGIPFFFLFYLGLKILVNNLKSIGNVAKFTLLGLWLFSIIGLVVIGVREASEHAFNERVIEKQTLNITATDTLMIKMAENDLFRNQYRNNGFKIANNENGEKTIYRSDVRILVKSTTDSVATIAIEKNADGRNYEKAINRAKNVNYNFNFNNETLLLDSYLSSAAENKFSDQEVVVTLYLPVGSVVKFNNNTESYLNNRMYSENIVSSNHVNHYLKITEDGIICDDCDEAEFEVNINTPNVKINSDGIEINSDTNNIKIDENGVKSESESVKVNIDSNGISIESDK
jgi:phage shock protein PspC (stress-responsive transcriptional regulator)